MKRKQYFKKQAEIHTDAKYLEKKTEIVSTRQHLGVRGSVH